MYDDHFQTFLLSVLFQPDGQNCYKRECLWVLNNIVCGRSEHNFEFIFDNKHLILE